MAQGKDVYMAALKDPDSLADAPDYHNYRFDDLPRMGDLAYEELTGRTAYENFDLTGYSSYRLYIEFNINFAQFELGLDIPNEYQAKDLA